MRLWLFLSVALLLLAAGCANNRGEAPELAPSRQAGMGSGGWSVPPGQKSVQDPGQAAPNAAAMDAAKVTPRDEQAAEATAAAEAERRRREAQERAQARADAATAQPKVAPLVPAFPVRMEQERVSGLRTVHFGFDDWELTPAARALLDENARWLKANPEIPVRVAGHADDRGTPEYNLALGERRAKRVRDYLIGQGVPADNLVTVTFGEEVPLVSGQNEAAWSQNRRAEFARAEERRVSGAAPRRPSS